MAQQANLLPAAPASLRGCWFVSWLLYYRSSSLLQAWENREERLKALDPCTHVGDLEEAPSSWLQLSSAPAIAATGGVNQWVEDLCVCVCLFSL